MSEDPNAFSSSGKLASASRPQTLDRILVVDDSPADQELMVRKLNNLHATVDTADNLETAYRLSRDNLPDVIILDVGLPIRSASGHATMADVLEFVRYHSDKHCVVVVTGNFETDESDIREFYAAGALDYISKDIVNVDLELMDRVRRAHKAHIIANENRSAAQVMVQIAKMGSRQDKMFLMMKRMENGVTNIRESERKLLYDQAFKAGQDSKEKEYKKKRLLRKAAMLGTLFGATAWMWQPLWAFIKGFIDGKR